MKLTQTKVAPKLTPAEELEIIGEAPPADDILTVRVLKPALNQRYVYAALDGIRIPVLCPKKGRKNVVGKNVRVRREILPDGNPTYTLIP